MKRYSVIILVLIFCCTSIPGISQNVDAFDNPQKELIQRADSLISKYQFETALSILIEGDSLNIDVLLRIGQCNFLLGASVGASRPFERVLQLDSVNITALNHLGQLYARDGEFQKALSCFEQLATIDSTNAYYCKQAGAMAARSRDIFAAQLWYQRALNLNPRDTESAVALANILMEMEQYESVDSIVQVTLKIHPDFKPLLMLRAKSAFEQRHYRSVVIAMNTLLEKTDTTVLFARLLGLSYFHTGDYNSFIRCMQFLLKNKYEFDWVYYYMGLAFRELGDAPASVRWLNQAVEKSISENTSVYYTQLGQSYEEMGDYQSAIRAYRAAYNYSKEGILLYHLARNYDVYYKDKAMAVAYYQKYLASDDTIRQAREYARKRMQDMGHF
jgi:tetratricopeptide (TPR) repeat protein